MFGGAVFWTYAGQEVPLDGPLGLPTTFRRTLLLLRVAAAVAAVSGIAWLGGTIANATGGWETLVDAETLHVFFFETPFGVPAIVRLVLFALLIMAAGAPAAPRLRIRASLGLGATLLISQAWLGHAVEGGKTLLGASMIAAYAAHTLAAGAWVGSLPPLAFALAERRFDADAEGVFDLLVRYSAMAMIAVGVIVTSGIANTAFHAGDSLIGLASSGYAVVLFVKLGLVMAMVLLAAINCFAILPRLRERRDLSAPGLRPASGLRGLRVSVALEGGLALLVLAAAAVLGITPPPH